MPKSDLLTNQKQITEIKNFARSKKEDLGLLRSLLLGKELVREEYTISQRQDGLFSFKKGCIKDLNHILPSQEESNAARVTIQTIREKFDPSFASKELKHSFEEYAELQLKLHGIKPQEITENLARHQFHLFLNDVVELVRERSHKEPTYNLEIKNRIYDFLNYCAGDEKNMRKSYGNKSWGYKRFISKEGAGHASRNNPDNLARLCFILNQFETCALNKTKLGLVTYQELGEFLNNFFFGRKKCLVENHGFLDSSSFQIYLVEIDKSEEVFLRDLLIAVNGQKTLKQQKKKYSLALESKVSKELEVFFDSLALAMIGVESSDDEKNFARKYFDQKKEDRFKFLIENFSGKDFLPLSVFVKFSKRIDELQKQQSLQFSLGNKLKILQDLETIGVIGFEKLKRNLNVTYDVICKDFKNIPKSLGF